MTDINLDDMSRDEFAAHIDASWARWLAAIDALTDEQLQAPGSCGEWSVKDLLGHVATWDSVAIDKVHGIRAGADRLAPDESVDDFNARSAEALRDEPLAALREQMELVHARLLTVLEGTSDLPDEMAHLVVWAISEDTWQHYDEHAQQVVAAFPSGDAVT